MAGRIRVGVLFGGQSGEHEVSLASARSVMEAMDREKYEILPIGITKEGRWIASGNPLDALAAGEMGATERVAFLPDPSQRGLVRLDAGTVVEEADSALAHLQDMDVVIPVLHGTFGEDGTVQGLLELAGMPYVGADVLSSALAMDKIVFKSVLRGVGLPVVDYVAVKRRDWRNDPATTISAIEERLTYPLFTKPANMGSSVGVSKCRDRDELRAGLGEAARYDRKLLVELAVPRPREIEVSVLGNDEPIASVPGEILPSREFYSYRAKYLDRGEDASELLIPAPLSADMSERVQEMALQAYRAIDCCGMARADFLLSAQSDELYVNELNTIPGFTSISMYPKLWEQSGVPYSELIDRLIDLAFERHRDRAQSETSYQVEV